jgi:hypothetical protein
MTIKAIETRYHGYHFRSRLEARWAVFFDEVRLDWEYELEGFSFDGIAYLPDFYFPDLGIWCEIKGKLISEARMRSAPNLFGNTPYTYTEYPELEKAQKLRDYDNAVAVVVGSPGKEKIHLYAYDLCDSGGGIFNSESGECEWVVYKGRGIGLRATTRDDRCLYSDGSFNIPLNRGGYIDPTNESSQSRDIILRAVDKSRAIRFDR